MAAFTFTSALTMVPSTKLDEATVIPVGNAPVASLLSAMAAPLAMSALTMSLTVRALLSLVGVTVSPDVNVYA